MTIIRPELAGDAAAIAAVQLAAFPTAAECDLVEALRRDGHLRLSLVASHDGQVVGHIAFSPLDAPGGVGLAPVAVLPDHQRQGVGAQLVHAGIAACAKAGLGFIVVLGDPKYYSRFGFRPASQWGLSDEYGGGDAFQLLVLREKDVPHGIGLVRYAPPFAALGDGHESPD